MPDAVSLHPESRRKNALGVHSLDHFAIAVPDLTVARDFFAAFGLDSGRKARNWGSTASGTRIAGRVSCAALGIRPRTVITCCAVGFSAIGALSGMVSSLGALLALRVAMGIFEGPVIPLIQSVVSKASPGWRRGANLGMIIGGSALVGSVLAPPLMMGLAEGIGWRFAFLAVALPGPFVALGVWLVTRPYDSVEAEGRAARIGFREVAGIARQRNVLIGVVGGGGDNADRFGDGLGFVPAASSCRCFPLSRPRPGSAS